MTGEELNFKGMSFSERYGYKTPKPLELEGMSDELRARIWNWFQKTYEDIENLHRELGVGVAMQAKVIESIWDGFFHGDIQELRRNYSGVYSGGVHYYSIESIRERFYKMDWNIVYDFAEYVLNQCLLFNADMRNQSAKSLNEILEEEKAGYRVICCKNMWYVTPIISPQEIEEIEKASNHSGPYQPVAGYIAEAVEHYRKRPQAEYEDSLKDSILVLEALVKRMVSPKGAFSELVKELKIHGALKKALEELYGWASDIKDVRHAKGEIPQEKVPIYSVGEAEARLALVLASALTNYLISKQLERNTKGQQENRGDPYESFNSEK
jgi:hypothetical protein